MDQERLAMRLRKQADIYSAEHLEHFDKAKLQLAGDLRSAAMLIERMYEWIHEECHCPCCKESQKCLDDCTFADDAPNDAERMDSARYVLFG